MARTQRRLPHSGCQLGRTLSVPDDFRGPGYRVQLARTHWSRPHNAVGRTRQARCHSPAKNASWHETDTLPRSRSRAGPGTPRSACRALLRCDVEHNPRVDAQGMIAPFCSHVVANWTRSLPQSRRRRPGPEWLVPPIDAVPALRVTLEHAEQDFADDRPPVGARWRPLTPSASSDSSRM